MSTKQDVVTELSKIVSFSRFDQQTETWRLMWSFWISSGLKTARESDTSTLIIQLSAVSLQNSTISTLSCHCRNEQIRKWEFVMFQCLMCFYIEFLFTNSFQHKESTSVSSITGSRRRRRCENRMRVTSDGFNVIFWIIIYSLVFRICE